MRAELERVLNGFAVRRLELVPGVRLERAGNAVAALCPALPELDFVNRIYGVEDPTELGPLEELYAVEGLRPWVELPEGLEPDGWERLEPVWVLAGPAASLPAETVLEVGSGEAELFAATFCDGNGAPAFARRPVSRWAGEPGWRLYLAELDGAPAAAALLVVAGAIGCLAAASTLPAFRGRGCQTALIRRRISDAAAAGCREVCALTANPASRRNLERCGLGLAYTKTAWRKL
ncbi:MAG TPA: GNAT family N-acetyltransferase [Gaiellaceae bacterium]|nr:GNAT family N-acetyltransferase [Gaiellaceae bacterium]